MHSIDTLIVFGQIFLGVFMNRVKLLLILLLAFSLAACKTWWSKDDDDYNPFQGMSADALYQEAQHKLAAKEYESAAKRYEALDTMYPFSDHAEQAQLNLIYAYYKNKDYASCAATAERFIHLYPRAAHADYAYYMKGLADFQQPRGNLANVLPMDESYRDPGTQAQAYSDFSTLVQTFPNSPYKPNALQRMIYLRNMFAKRELNAAYYYYSRRMYVAAIERADYLVKNYPQAPSVRKALIVTYRGNLALGLTKAAEEAKTVYEANYHEVPGEVKL